MLRIFLALLFLGTVGVISLAGFRGTRSSQPPIEIFPDMDHQPKYLAQHSTEFFADGRAARPPISGTVSMGYQLPGSYVQAGARNGVFAGGTFAQLPNYFFTGRFGEFYGDGFPEETKVDQAFLSRGEERYNIHCSVCHGRTGAADGVVKQVGNWATVANLLDDRIRTQPDGQIFNTITHGKNTMGAYGPNIAVEDRWAIVAHIRVLQRSVNAKLTELPEDKQKELQPAK